MRPSFNRRDFLKIASLAPFSLALPPLVQRRSLLQPVEQRKNVLIVVFDAFSAFNASLYGYARQTTPNIDRLAKWAVVYRQHYAGANFTTSGVATLLTGAYPWTHRAIQFRGRTIPRFYDRNAFSVFDDYYRFAYTHNGWAHAVMRPMASQLSEMPAVEELFLETAPEFIRTVLRNDDDIATVAWGRDTGLGYDGYAYSLYFSSLLLAMRDQTSLREIRQMFPRGMPGDGGVNTFMLETATDWVIDRAGHVRQPFFGYVHFLPPHAPYRTRIDFVDRFKDDEYRAARKPVDMFAAEVSRDEQAERREYDEYILYADAEFGRLYDALEASGALEHTWLVLTSDHGELFERGLKAHGTDTLYEPEIRVPLLIFEPGRKAGLWIDTPTSAVDLLPTLAKITGHALPAWTEGSVLPPYAEDAAAGERPIYSFMAEDNHPLGPIDRATAAMVRGDYRLQYYFGYKRLPGRERTLLFDVREDPEELVNLASDRPEVTSALLAELKAAMAEAEAPYQRG